MSTCCSPRLNKRKAGACLALLSSAIVGLAACGMPAAAAPPDARRQGELTRLVRQDCGSCHGLTLKGGLGKSLLPDDLQPLSTEQIADVILEGMAGTPMPPWKGLVQRDEALWIAARLKEGFPQ